MSGARVLVVGAGAVGQVYGRHAQLAGADVTFFVREKYRDEVTRGFTMYPLNRRRNTEPVEVTGFAASSRAPTRSRRARSITCS